MSIKLDTAKARHFYSIGPALFMWFHRAPIMLQALLFFEASLIFDR